MVRFGILGFGLHAVKRLMPGFAAASNARVTALSRRTLERAQASARQHGIPLAFADARQMCASPEVDAVFVATPNSCHLADVLLALECGKPVLVEKPMGMNAAECRQMTEAARRAGVPLGVAQVFRFEQSVQRARQLVAKGGLGEVIFARAEFSFPGIGHARAWLTTAAIAGGGPIADVGVHCIDALRYILADEPARVTARAVRDEHAGEVESAAVVLLEFRRGALGVVPVSYRAAYRTPLEIVGTEGTLFADDAFTVDKIGEIRTARSGQPPAAEPFDNRHAYALQVDAFAAAVEGGTEFPVPGEDGLRNQAVLDAAYRSVKSGRAEEVDGS